MSLRSWGRSTPAAIATLLLGFGLGCLGFFRFLPRFASDNNDLMLEAAKRQAEGRMAGEAVVTGPVALTALAPLMFVPTTPLGWLSAYLVVVASRRRPEWTVGTILDCGERFYSVGEPAERTLPGGLRTLYPLTEAPHAGVFRRIVRYDLPALQPDRTKG